MLDPRFIVENPDTVRESLTRRNADETTLASLERIIEIDGLRRSLITQTDELRATRNQLTKQIGPLMKEGRREEAEPLRAEVTATAETLSGLDEQLDAIATEQTDLLLRLPNVVDERVPPGSSDEDNVEIRTFGEPREMDFEPKDHHDLGTDLGILDFPAQSTSKVQGIRS